MAPSASPPPSAPPSASQSQDAHPPPEKLRPAFAGPPAGPEPPFPIRLSGPIIKGFGRGSKELGIPTANIPISGLSVGGHEDVESGIYFGFAGVDIDDTGRRIGEDGKRDGDGDGNGNGNGNAASTAEKKDQQQIVSEGRRDVTLTDDDNHDAEDAKIQGRHQIQNDTQNDNHPITTPNPQNRGNIYPMVMSIGWNPFYKNTVRSVEVHLLPPQPFQVDFYGARMNLLILGFIRPEYDYVSAESLVRDIRIDIEVARRSLEREGWGEWGREAWLLRGL